MYLVLPIADICQQLQALYSQHPHNHSQWKESQVEGVHPAANAAEIDTLVLDSSATAAAVAEAQRSSLGWRNILSRHLLTEAYYYNTTKYAPYLR